MTLPHLLAEIREKTEAMLHWQKLAKQDINEGPYPTMIALLAALSLCMEQRNAKGTALAEAVKSSYWPQYEDAELAKLLEGV